MSIVSELALMRDDGVILTGADVLSLAFLLEYPPGDWAATPPCFKASALCRDQARRGVTEIFEGRDGVSIRLTAAGREGIEVWLSGAGLT